MNKYYLAISTLAVLITYVFWNDRRERRNKPPSPFIFPIIGNSWIFNFMGPYGIKNMRHIHLIFDSVHKIWGDIVYLKVGNKPTLIIRDEKIIEEYFHMKDNNAISRHNSETLNECMGSEGLIWNNGNVEEWKKYSCIRNDIGKEVMGDVSYSDIIMEETEIVINDIKNLDNNDPLHIIDHLENYFKSIAMRRIFGSHFEKSDLDVVNKSHLIIREYLSHPLDFFPTLGFLLSSRRNILKKSNDTLIVMTNKYIDNHKDTMPDSYNHRRDILDSLLMMQNNKLFSDKGIIGTLNSIIFAASSTVMDSLDWFLLFSCINPNIQQKCYDEILNAKQSYIPNDKETEFEYVCKNLPYVLKCFKETLRLRPPGPLGLPHKIDKNMNIGKYYIEKDTIVIINHYSMGNSSKHENSSIFNPERFGDQDSKLSQFGYGPTRCPGNRVAVKIFLFLVYNLFLNFKFELPKNAPIPDTAGEFGAIFCPKPWTAYITHRL